MAIEKNGSPVGGEMEVRREGGCPKESLFSRVRALVLAPGRRKRRGSRCLVLIRGSVFFLGQTTVERALEGSNFLTGTLYLLRRPRRRRAQSIRASPRSALRARLAPLFFFYPLNYVSPWKILRGKAPDSRPS